MKSPHFRLLSSALIAGILTTSHASAELVRFVQIIKDGGGTTQFHLSELEAFSNGVVPDDLGGATGRGLTTSTNDIGAGALITYGNGNLVPTVGTTDSIQHGGANENPDNALQNGGAVWSTNPGLATPSQYTLDLGATFDVTTVRLWPRNDTCCVERWVGLQVHLYADDGTGNPGALIASDTDASGLNIPDNGAGTLADPGGNNAIEISFNPGSVEIEEILLAPAITFPTPNDPVVLSSASLGTLVGTLSALNEFGFEIDDVSFSLEAGAGDTNNGSYDADGPELQVTGDLSGLDGVVHSINVRGTTEEGFSDQNLTFTVVLDSDNDGLIDDWEEQFGVLGDFATGADSDSDGLNDEEEFLCGTDPSDPDGDDDGISDGDEKNVTGTDPFDNDSDDDTILDGAEVDGLDNIWTGTTNSGAPGDATDPLNNDSDNDGITDGDEVNGTNGFVTNPALSDTDGDGFPDNVEDDQGTDPTDDADFPATPAGNVHRPGDIFFRRTDGLAGAENSFTGVLPINVDLELPLDELDDGSSIITQLNIDTEAGAPEHGIDLSGDNYDLAFTFQFHDDDGQFSFTENFDDRVRVDITPIVSSRNLTARGDAQSHSDIVWNVRTFGDYDFGSGGWFDAQVWLVEDGGGAQSAAGLGFGYSPAISADEFAFGGLGYPDPGGAAFDEDGNGESFGSMMSTFPPDDSDGDNIPDAYEEALFPNEEDPLAPLGPGDFDGDGVNDPDEFANGTDPTEEDSDMDGSTDGEEVVAMTDPLDPDSDDDGLLDGVETNTGEFVNADDTGSDPNDTDTDDDGFDDLLEVNLGSNPNDANSVPDIPDILACWDFDDDSDPTMTLDIVSGFAGVLQGGAAYTADGGGRTGEPGDLAMDFGADNGGQTVLVEDASFLNLVTELDLVTIMWWQKLVNVSNSSAFWAVSPSSGGNERGMQVHSPWGNGTIFFDSVGCCAAPAQRLSGAPLEATDWTEWQHFAIVKNGETKEIWLNGALQHTNGPADPLPTDFTQLWLGSEKGNNSLQGVMDDFAISGKALTGEEITEFMENGCGSSGPGLQMTDIVYDQGNEEFTLSWTAREGATYGLYFSSDAMDWGADVNDSIDPTNPGGDPLVNFTDGILTYGPFANPLPGAPEIFFRAQEN